MLITHWIGINHLAAKNLQGDLRSVAQVLGQIDRGHPARTKLVLNAVATFEDRVQPLDRIGVGLAAKMRGELSFRERRPLRRLN